MDAQENHRNHWDSDEGGHHGNSDEGGHHGDSHEGGWHSDEDNSHHWSDEDGEGGRYDGYHDKDSDEDDHGKQMAMKAGMFIFCIAIVVVIVLVVLCCLKKKNRRAMSVADMHVVVKAPQPKPGSAPRLPKKSHFEIVDFTHAKVHNVAPAPAVPFAPPPEYRSTVDLRAPAENPRTTIGMMSPPPAYTENSTAAPY